MQTLTATDSPTSSLQPTPVSPNGQPCFQSIVPDYALLFFDHLCSEYLTLKSTIKNTELTALLDSLQEKRLKSKLTWSDIYSFDLALVDVRPLENLVRKAFDARAKYRSVAGQKEFDEYLASKPPDLTAILIAPPKESQNGAQAGAVPPPGPPAGQPPPAPPAGPPPPGAQLADISDSAQIVQRVLRADIKYLLSKFYLYYAMLPMRENLREQLTTRAVTLTKWILALIVALILASFGGGLILKRFSDYGDLIGAFGVTVGSVAFAGIVGGCVSMLQRIQSAPSEGDALFNLAALTNGWRGLSLSPLYGGIFASLLFILFAAGLLQGSAFPKIETATGTLVEKANGEQTKNQNPAPAATPGATPSTDTQASTTNTQATTTDTQAGTTPTQRTTDTQRTAETQRSAETQRPTETQRTILHVKDFLQGTGPRDGVSFALLMIWSFIAGFAERLVPDTLNRLVAKNEAIQGTNS